MCTDLHQYKLIVSLHSADTAAIVLGVVLALVIAVIFILFFGLVCVIILCCYLRRNKDKEVGKG